jgi:hypothetical protein
MLNLYLYILYSVDLNEPILFLERNKKLLMQIKNNHLKFRNLRVLWGRNAKINIYKKKEKIILMGLV